MGADKIAVGGLLDTNGERSGGHATGADDIFEILQRIQEMHPKIWNQTWTFALGCDHPRRRPRFANLNVQAADSKRWLYQYDNALPASREEQLINHVVQSTSYRTTTLNQDLSTDGGTSNAGNMDRAQ